jgi:mycothiol synthase
VIHPHHRYDSLEIAPELLRNALDVVATEGGGHVHWWVFEASNVHRQLAQTAGLRPGRRLLQMRRSLPLEDELLQRVKDFAVTTFRPGIDEDAWLAVNNAAFAHHPEQGGWTREIMELRKAEPWFDPAGFHMYWEHNDLQAFCWTKVHSDTEPPMGEIYVIAVDPAHAGGGLGSKMTIAALHHLTQHNLPIAMLYVDADNAQAISVYTALGFRPHHSEHAFVGDVPARETPK